MLLLMDGTERHTHCHLTAGLNNFQLTFLKKEIRPEIFQRCNTFSIRNANSLDDSSPRSAVIGQPIIAMAGQF